MCNIVVSIHFKYILAGRQDLILTSVAHLRKVVGVLEVRTWSGAGVSVLVCTQGAAFEMNWWWFGVFQLILQYNTHFSPRLHVLTWYTRRN